MARSSCKLVVRSEEESTGCSSGWISMLDFFPGNSAGNLVSDGKCKNDAQIGKECSSNNLKTLRNFEGMHKDADNIDKKEEGRINFGIPTIKELMEEEIAQAYPPKKDSISEVQITTIEKNHKRARNHKASNGFHDNFSSFKNLGNILLDFLNLTEISVNLPALEADNCQESHQHNHIYSSIETTADFCPWPKRMGCRKQNLDASGVELAQKNSMFHKILGNAPEAFLKDWSLRGKHWGGKRSPYGHKQLTEAVGTLNPNKKFLQKILDDSDLNVSKHSQGFQDNDNLCKLHSFNEVGDELFGEEVHEPIQHEESRNDSLINSLQKQTRFKVFGRKNESKRTKTFKGINDFKTSKNLVVVDKVIKNNTFCPNSSQFAFHLPLGKLMKNLKSTINESQNKKFFISMDSFLQGIPNWFQNLGDTRKTSDRNMSVAQSSSVTSKSDSEAIIRHPRIDSSKKVKNHKKWKKRTLGHFLYKESFCQEAKNKSGNLNEILPTRKDFTTLKEVLSVPEHKLSSPDFSTEEVLEMRHFPSKQTKQDSNAEDFRQVKWNSGSLSCTSGSSCDNLRLFDLESALIHWKLWEELRTRGNMNAKEELERLSPVAVPEPIFWRNKLSSISKIAEQAEHKSSFQISALRLEAKLECVRFVSEASCINCNELSERWDLLGQILDLHLFNEIKILHSELLDERKLLFDCINEVLVELHYRLFSCSPWIFIIKPVPRLVPVEQNFIQEVCKGVVQLLSSQFPATLENLICQDLDSRTWMDIRIEMENTVSDIGDDVLEDLMEECVQDPWISHSFGV